VIVFRSLCEVPTKSGSMLMSIGAQSGSQEATSIDNVMGVNSCRELVQTGLFCCGGDEDSVNRRTVSEHGGHWDFKNATVFVQPTQNLSKARSAYQPAYGLPSACSKSFVQRADCRLSAGNHLTGNDNKLQEELQESRSSELSDTVHMYQMPDRKTNKLQKEVKESPRPEASDIVEMSQVSEQGTKTTLMLRNIPFELNLDEFALKIETAGFGDCYDMLYLPMKRGNVQNRGYAFLNFHSHIFADRFTATFHKQNLNWANVSGARKLLNVTEARVQGFMETIQLVRNQNNISQLEKQLLVKV